ncbi:hypothetical protein WJX84_012094 [Apatococcus fuscideae]|uniref:Protein disulfide-isomerase n=1 Tax=Apatococcus fuscideae TaxID=2026836 RepID=A0AAW1T901_9CHLO
MVRHSAFYLAAAASLCLGFAAAEDVVVVSGPKEFDALLKDNSFVVAEFFAPWCGHCKKLAPEYEKAAGPLKKNNPPVTLASIDATEEANKPLAEKYGVQGFPTLKIFKGGDASAPTDYNGPREADGIVSYLQKQSGPASVELTSKADVPAFVQKEVAVLGVFADAKSTEFKTFSAAADAARDEYDFGHVFDSSFLDGEAEPQAAPSILMFKQYDAPMLKYQGKLTDKAAIMEWLSSKSLPSLVELDQKPRNRAALQKIFSSPTPKLLGFAGKDDSNLAEFKKALTDVPTTGAALQVVFIETGGNAQALQYFGIEAKDTPAFVIHDQNNNAKYISFNTKPSKLPGFVSDYEAGKLEKHVKTEAPPKKNNGPVKVVTGTTFEDIVLAKGQNTMIEFYAPWCGHCKTLAPIYEEVGEFFQKNKTVTIAKMDATANDVPDGRFQVKGFPTLMFVDSKGEIKPYEGERTKDGLVEFIEANSVGASSSAASKEEL